MIIYCYITTYVYENVLVVQSCSEKAFFEGNILQTHLKIIFYSTQNLNKSYFIWFVLFIVDVDLLAVGSCRSIIISIQKTSILNKIQYFVNKVCCFCAKVFKTSHNISAQQHSGCG